MNKSRVACSSVLAVALLCSSPQANASPAEAPAGFDNRTNGYVDQSQFDKNRAEFEHEQTIDEGLGPVYTARSCAACHGNPVAGGGSQTLHTQVGHAVGGTFLGASAELGDGSAFSLVPFSGFLWPRAICPEAEMRLSETGADETVRNRLMHDGESRTFTESILRHAGEAEDVTRAFSGLTEEEKAQLIKFLKSL